MSAGKGDTTRPFSWAKWDASKLWKKPSMNTPTPTADAWLAGYYDNQCTLDAHATMKRLERELAAERAVDWRALMESEVANLRAELANERALADRLARWLDTIGCGGREQFRWSLTKAESTAREALAAYQQARNPAQTTGEGAE